MKRQLHTRSKNLQSTFIHFVEFQFTVKMLKQMSVSRIPDRLRPGVRGRVDVDCSRRDSEDSVDPDDVRGDSADCMAAPPQPCFSISHLGISPQSCTETDFEMKTSNFVLFLLISVVSVHFRAIYDETIRCQA